MVRWFGTRFNPEIRALVVRILGSNRCYQPNRRAKQRSSRNSEKSCDALTAAVHFENTKLLDGGDESSIRPDKTNTQVNIFMQQQSGSRHSVSPEHILFAGNDSRSRCPLNSWLCAGSELGLIQRSGLWLSGYGEQSVLSVRQARKAKTVTEFRKGLALCHQLRFTSK